MARFLVFGLHMAEARADHILIPIHDFSLGGTERIAFRLAGEWVRRGRKVTVLAGAADGPMLAQLPHGVMVELLEQPVPRSTFSRLRLGPAMTAAAQRLKPDAIFLIGNFHFAVARALRKALPAAPIVGKVSNPLVPAQMGTGPVARRLASWWSGAVDKLVAMSPGLQEELALLVPHARACAVPDPFLDDGITITPREGTPGTPLKLLFVGRLEPQKDPQLALATAASLHKRGVAFKLTMIGGGAMEQAVRRSAKRLGLTDSVDLLGHVDNPAPYFRAADMLLMSSRYEGVPAVIGEALAAGMPFVSTPCTAWLAGMVTRHPSVGTVVPRHDAELLAAAIIARQAAPFPSAADIEQAIAGHRLSAGADAYLALFDELVAAR